MHYRKYWLLFKVAFQNRLADRADFVLEIFGNTVVLLAVIAVWTAAYEQGATARSGLDYRTLLTYLLAAGILTGFYRRAQGDDINDDIVHGMVSAILVKPVSLPVYWLIRDLAVRIIELPFVLGMIALISYVLGFQPILSFGAVEIASFLAFAVLAMLFHYFLFTAVAMIGFWLDHTWGERFVLNVIIEVASGALIPLSFFPHPWEGILRHLPFSVLVAKPVEALLGMRNLAWSFAEVGVWLAGGIALTHYLLRRGLRRYAGEGVYD